MFIESNTTTPATNDYKQGWEAIQHAEATGEPLNAFASVFAAEENISIDHAREIANIEPSLIWCL